MPTTNPIMRESEAVRIAAELGSRPDWPLCGMPDLASAMNREGFYVWHKPDLLALYDHWDALGLGAHTHWLARIAINQLCL
jgi:hypothetical protein